jgi:outer membrane protein OmpA-like peptidoglycan-associated protein
MDAVVLENVFFETGSYRLNNRSQYELKTLARFLLAHPQYCFEIGGHTDNVGTYADNLKLSEQRADAVIRFLVEEGVPYSMLRSAGYADTHPRANNSTEAGKAKNRRTELKRCQE